MGKSSTIKKNCSSPTKPLIRQTSTIKRSGSSALKLRSPNRQQQQPRRMSPKRCTLSIAKTPSPILKRNSTNSSTCRTSKHYSKRREKELILCEWRPNAQYITKDKTPGNDIATMDPTADTPPSLTSQASQSSSTSSSSSSPTSSTFPFGFNAIPTTSQSGKLEQPQQQQAPPEDVAKYFESNPQAWGYLRSLTNGIKSYGLDHFGRSSAQLNINDNQDKAYLYTPSGFLIGSDPSCDISIPNMESRHSFIYMRWYFENGMFLPRLLIFDCSNNGLTLDERPVEKFKETPLVRHVYSSGKNSQEIYIPNAPIIQFNGKTPEAKVLFQLHVSAQKIMCSRRRKMKIDDLYQYDPTTKIGGGSYGYVYKARCKLTNKVVALKKMILNEKPGNVIEALCRETAINVFLKPHPCIIRYENVMEECCTTRLDDQICRITKNVYIVMEHGKDGDLFDLVTKAPPIPEDDVIVIFDQLFHAISHLHNHGIAHRDLKLENVVVLDKENYQVKLCDFGVATFERIGHTFVTYCGTLEYIAPEIFSNENHTKDGAGYTKAVDIWSLGIMLYSTISRHSPYPASCGDKKAMYQCISGGEFPDFSGEGWNGVSEEGKDLIRKMLVLDPKQRYTIGQLLEHPWSQRAKNLKNRNESLAKYLATCS